MNARNFKTEKGTDLPLLNLRGKEYLEVKYRLVWFREDHSDWSIETDLLQVTDTSAYAKATIRDESCRVIATSHKFESVQGFPDFIEKAETGAIGRALALIGYGTQFCADELDEGGRIVDAPVSRGGTPARGGSSGRHEFSRPERRPQPQGTPARGPVVAAPAPAPVAAAPVLEQATAPQLVEDPAQESPETASAFSPGDYTISFGRKYKGRKLNDIPRQELESYINWLESTATQEGKPVSHQVKYLRTAFDRMYIEQSAI